METIPSPAERLKHVLSAASIEPITAPQLIESHSNDAWLLDDARLGSIVLRVSWRGDVTRLEREARVAEQMPASVRYPPVVGYGRTSIRDFPLGYSMTRRLEGRQLNLHWPSLSTAEQRSLVAQLAEMLRDLHAWTPPADLAGWLLARPDLRDGGMTGLLGADIVPLPLARAIAMAEHGKTLPYVDPGLMSAAIDAIEELRHLEPEIDDPAAHGLIHADLHLSNIWWSEPNTITLLDLEWTRFGPPLLDLECLCRSADDEASAGDDTHLRILRGLEADYPEPFQVPDAAERMRLYSLAYSIRHVLVGPPDRPAAEMPADHAVHRLLRLAKGDWPAPGSLPDSLMPTGGRRL